MSKFTSFLGWARSYRTEYSRTDLKNVWKALKNFECAANQVRLIYLRHCDVCHGSLIKNTNFTSSVISRKEGLQCYGCGKCSKCCQCIACPGCSSYTQDICLSCHNCSQCCGCVFCNRCGNECDNNYCYDCDHCYDCCRCEDENHKIEFFHNEPKFHSCNKMQHKINPTSRFIAAEIEVADIEVEHDDGKIAGIVREWGGSIVKDGSLPHTGFEINTAPASGDLFVKQIVDICRALEDVGAKVNNKCGLHVHLDARDFNYYDIRRLVKLYAHIEPTLFCMVPQSRLNSHYCKPCGEKYKWAIDDGRLPYDKVRTKIVGTIYHGAAGKDIKDAKRDKYNDARYNALNLHSWFYRGTIECRLFNGTTNVDKIVNWGIMWSMILDCVIHSSDNDIDSLIKSKSSFDTLITIACKNVKVVDFIKQRYIQHNGKK